MRLIRLAAVAAAALSAAACFQSTTVLKIKADGSGTIEQTTMVTEAALRQLRQFAASDAEASKQVDLFSATRAREVAASLGRDVTLVSTTPIKNAAGEGSKTVFAFADVGRLQLKQAPANAMTAGITGVDSAAAQVHLSMEQTATGHAVLRISIPPFNAPKAAFPTAPAGSSASAPRLPPEQLAMFKQLFAGMRVSVFVEPHGQLVKTTSPFVDGQRVTLLDLSLDDILANDSVFTRLQGAQSMDDVKAAMKMMPGLKITLDPETTIEFAAAR